MHIKHIFFTVLHACLCVCVDLKETEEERVQGHAVIVTALPSVLINNSLGPPCTCLFSFSFPRDDNLLLQQGTNPRTISPAGMTFSK